MAAFLLLIIVFIVLIIIYFFKKKKINSFFKTNVKTISVISLIIGTIFFVSGLVSLIMRDEIIVRIVGRERLFKEMLWGGSSVQDSLTIIIVISSIAIFIGLVLIILGIKNTVIQK